MEQKVFQCRCGYKTNDAYAWCVHADDCGEYVPFSYKENTPSTLDVTKSPKEKAKELIDNFQTNGLLDKFMGKASAKMCSEICVKELIKAEETKQNPNQTEWEYWKQVLDEVINYSD